MKEREKIILLHEVDELQPEDGAEGEGLNQLLQVKFPIITKEIK